VLANPDLFSSRNPTGPTSVTSLARRVQLGEVDVTGLTEGERQRLSQLAGRRALVGSAPALFTADPPMHTAHREVVAPALDATQLTGLEPLVARLASELMDGFVDRGQVELVGEFCRPLALRVMATMLGVDETDGVRFERWTRALFLGVGRPDLGPRELLSVFEDISDCYDYFTARLEKAEGSAGDDLIHHVLGVTAATTETSRARQLQILTQLMVAGSDSTANLLASVALQLVDHPDLEERLRTDMSRVPDFVEEVLRIEAPTAGMHRVATSPTRLGGVDIPAGSYVFLSFQGANLDSDAFDAPRDITFDRPDNPQHLSFGAGIHACVGAGLARMLVRVALEMLLGRIRNVRCQQSQEDLPYAASFANRGPLQLPFEFERNDESSPAVTDAEHRPMLVEGQRLVADRVLELSLRPRDGLKLPAWEPGAHIELLLPSGAARQYSLCGDPADETRYVVAVLEEVDGRGGSAELHRIARADAEILVRPPRNNFPLKPSPRYLFLAGGIGVTPILTMVEAAIRQGAEWRLVFGGRNRSTMAYLDRIAGYTGGTVDLWPEDERGRPDLITLLGAQDERTLVYACGPTGLLDAVQAAHAEVRGLQPLRIERFAASAPVDTTGGGFEVVLAKSGKTLVVEEGVSILETVRTVLPRLSYSCEEGYCGECETNVLEGEPDHRDDFLDEDEHAAGELMMICVSRCLGPRLVLDL
jgi:cytochrome P450/ferredoxin-NADP reductase